MGTTILHGNLETTPQLPRRYEVKRLPSGPEAAS